MNKIKRFIKIGVILMYIAIVTIMFFAPKITADQEYVRYTTHRKLY